MTIALLLCPFWGSIAQNTHGCVVKNYHTSIEFDGITVKKFKSVDLLVTDRKGDYYSKIQIPYAVGSPPKQLKAYISTMLGTIVRELKPKEIIKKSNISDFSLYEDDMLYEFELRHNAYPYIIHFEYSTAYSQYINLCNWSPIYDTDLPTENASLSISTPTGLAVGFSERIIESHSKEDSLGKTIYKWNASFVPVPQESHALHLHDLAPSVTAVPMKFFYGIYGSLETWKDFGLWYSHLHKGMDVLTPSEKVKADKIIAKCKTDREKIDSLYRFLQNSKRYVNVSMDLGGIKSYPAEYVCNNGYGDCKALSNYMKSLLSHAGIKSEIALIYADETPYLFDPNLPSNQFNHVILCVPNANDTLWLECTSSFHPAGYLGSGTQNRYALLIGDQGGKLVKTPGLTPEDCLIAKNVAFNANDGSARITIEFNGPHYEEIKDIQSSAPERWHEQIIDHYLFSAFDANTWTFSQSNVNEPKINLHLTGIYPYDAKDNSGNLYYSVPSLPMPQFGKTAKRVSPIVFTLPANLSDTTVVSLPNQYSRLGSQAITEIKGNVATYKRMVELNGNQLKVIRTLTYPQFVYPADDYEKISTEFQSIKKTDRERILLIR